MPVAFSPSSWFGIANCDISFWGKREEIKRKQRVGEGMTYVYISQQG